MASKRRPVTDPLVSAIRARVAKRERDIAHFAETFDLGAVPVLGDAFARVWEAKFLAAHDDPVQICYTWTIFTPAGSMYANPALGPVWSAFRGAHIAVMGRVLHEDIEAGEQRNFHLLALEPIIRTRYECELVRFCDAWNEAHPLVTLVLERNAEGWVWQGKFRYEQ